MRLHAPLTIVLLALAGCGSSAASTPSAVQNFAHTDRVATFTSIGQLAAASSAVLRVRATNASTVERVQGIAFTVTDASLEETLRGSIPGATVRIRQLGAAGDGATTAGVPLVIPGQEYVVFVEPFVFSDDKPPGQYVIVGGGAGLYALEPTGALLRLDSSSKGLPAALDLPTLRTLLPK
jgi:hypothetical protein